MPRFRSSSHEKAKPVKTGDAKLKGLRTHTESGSVYGSQLPIEYPTAPFMHRGIRYLAAWQFEKQAAFSIANVRALRIGK